MDALALTLFALSSLPLGCTALYGLFPLPVDLVARRRVQWSMVTAVMVLGFWLLGGH